MGTVHDITDYKIDNEKYVEVMYCIECDSIEWYVTNNSMICCGCHNEVLFDEIE